MITSRSWFELWRIFSRSVFPTILEHGTGLFRLEGILSVMLDRKKTQHSTYGWENRRHLVAPPTNSPRKTSEKRAHKFHTDDASLSRSGQYFWLVQANFTSGTTNQKYYPDLGSDASSAGMEFLRSSGSVANCRMLPTLFAKDPLIGLSKSKCLPFFRSLPRSPSTNGAGTRDEPLRTTSAYACKAMSSGP